MPVMMIIQFYSVYVLLQISYAVQQLFFVA